MSVTLVELRGVLFRQLSRFPATAKTLSVVLDRPLWHVTVGLQSLAQRGMVEKSKQGYWQIKKNSAQSGAPIPGVS